MGKEWLTEYYRGLGWTEQRITNFLRKAELNEKVKVKEVKGLEFEVTLKEKGDE